MDVIWSQWRWHSPAAFLMGGASFAQTFVWEEKPSNAAWQDMIVVCHLCMWFEYEDQLSTLRWARNTGFVENLWIDDSWLRVSNRQIQVISPWGLRSDEREPQRIGWCGIEVRWCFGFSKAEPILDHAMCFATCGDLNTAFVGWWFWMYFSAGGAEWKFKISSWCIAWGLWNLMKKSWDRSPYQLVTGFHLMAPVVYLVRLLCFCDAEQATGSGVPDWGSLEILWQVVVLMVSWLGIAGAFSQKPKGCNLLMCRFWSSHQRVLFSALWWSYPVHVAREFSFFSDHFCRFPGQLWCETEELK